MLRTNDPAVADSTAPKLVRDSGMQLSKGSLA